MRGELDACPRRSNAPNTHWRVWILSALIQLRVAQSGAIDIRSSDAEDHPWLSRSGRPRILDDRKQSRSLG